MDLYINFEKYTFIMKKISLLFLLFLGFQLGYCQSTDEASCYTQWAKAFEVRGAEDIKDGWHDNIIVSIRTGSKNKCYTGKVLVENFTIKEIFIKYVDGKYDPFIPQLKYPDQKSIIVNGISKTLQSNDDELINIIFINHLKPKKKAYEVAPMPDLDDF